MKTKTIIRITTVPGSLRGLLKDQLRFMKEYYKVIAISSPGEILDEVRETQGVEVYPVQMTRQISPIKDFLAIISLVKIFRKERPMIVHTHTPKAGTLGMLAAKLAGVPHRLHTVAGLPLLEAKGKKRKVLDAVEKFTYLCATKVYPNSYGLLEIIRVNGYTDDEKLKVLGKGSSNGIDTSYFDPSLFSLESKVSLKIELGINPDDYVFIFVGRIVKDKGVNELIAAFSKLNGLHKNIKLIMLGNYERHLDPLLPETEKMIDENPNILRLGYKSDVRPYFSIANVLTFPSYREGFPNVVMQAASMSLPCIVSDINGCNEIISDSVNGFVIPVKDKEALFDAMKKCLENKEQSQKMAQSTREIMVGNYERTYVWNEILNEYKQLNLINMESYFFVPANILLRIPDIRPLRPDYIIIDLEDAIKQSERDTALESLSQLASSNEYFVRVPLHDEKETVDLTLILNLLTLGFTRFVLPKIDSGEQLDFIVRELSRTDLELIILIETPRFFLEAVNHLLPHKEIIHGLGLGSHDLISVLGGEHTLKNLFYLRQQVLLLARMIGAKAIDIASMDLNNNETLESEILDGFSMGYDGKFLIHPNQLRLLNDISFYNEHDQAWAEKVVEILGSLSSKNEFNPVVVDGKVIEKPHLNKAMKIMNFINKKHGK